MKSLVDRLEWEASYAEHSDARQLRREAAREIRRLSNENMLLRATLLALENKEAKKALEVSE